MLDRLRLRASRPALWATALALGSIWSTPSVLAAEPATDAAPAIAAPAADAAGAASVSREIQVPAPPFSEDIFPCMDCHEEGEPNPQRRVLTEYHEDIELHHDEENRWCLDCHDERNRDYLRLASGTLVPFDRSYLLCGQCHGPTLRAWKAGVHGRRTGRWDGAERYYLLCVHCHNPHHPRFPRIRPLPRPIAPGDLRASLSQPLPPPLVIEPVSPFASPDDAGDESEGDDDGE